MRLTADARSLLDHIYETTITKGHERISLSDIVLSVKMGPEKLSSAIIELDTNNLIRPLFSPPGFGDTLTRHLSYDEAHFFARILFEIDKALRLTIGQVIPVRITVGYDAIGCFAEFAQWCTKDHREPNTFAALVLELTNEKPKFAEFYDTNIVLTPKGRKLSAPPSLDGQNAQLAT